MNLSKKELVARYLKKYLEDFTDKGITSDIHYFNEAGIEIGAWQACCGREYIEADMHELRFKEFYNRFKSITRNEIIDIASTMENLLVIDIGSSTFGGKFGLHIADMNKDSEVLVFNPFRYERFPQVLFNGHNDGEVYKFNIKTPYHPDNLENSVNMLYAENNLRNIRFINDYVTEGVLDMIARKNPDRDIILYFDRVWDILEEIIPVVKRYNNVEMVVAPVLNGKTVDLAGDETSELITRNYKGIKDLDGSRDKDNEIDAHARLAIAARAYISLSIAERVNGFVYNEKDRKNGFAFHQPTHYISSMRLK